MPEPPRPQQTVLVAHASAELYGSDLQMLETVSAFQQAGWHVVVALPSTGPLIARLQERGVDTRIGRFPVLRQSALSPRGFTALAVEAARAQLKIRRLLNEVRPHLVYVNTTVIPWWITAAAAARIPVLCHVHEAEDTDNRAVLVALAAPLLLADGVVCISETAREATLSAIPRLRDRIYLVHNGVPDRPVDPVDPPESASPYRLALVGRLSPRKGCHIAIDAVVALRDQGRDVTLEVVGSTFEGYDWYEQELRKAAAPHRDAITFRGFVNPVWQVWDHAHTVLAPSLREPFGNAVVEAQLAQRPVVAVAAAGHLETVQDGISGLLCTPDSADMAAKVSWLMDHPEEARRIGRDARASARSKFSLSRYRQEIVAAAQATVQPRRARA